MIGRYGQPNVYREIFTSEDFVKTAVGGALIPLAFLFKAISIQKIPGMHVMDIILILSVCINGVPIVIEAVKGIARRRMNVDELVSIAIIACMVNGNYLEAAIVSAIMVTGALIEEAVSDSARHAIEALVQVRPDTALLERNGAVIEVKASEIVKGDILVVKPGGMIPVDGEIIEGISGVDESAVTGESLPKQKKIGDEVWAGTLNTDGYIRVTARRVGKDATMGKMSVDIPEAASVVNIPGRGVRGMINGREIEILTTDKFSEAGYTTVEIVVEKETKGYICMQDQARPTAAGTVRELNSLGIKDLAVISGDQEAPVRNICNEIGIQHYFAGQSPEDKRLSLKGSGFPMPVNGSTRLISSIRCTGDFSWWTFSIFLYMVLRVNWKMRGAHGNQKSR